ncbi:VanZ family protein [Cohnella hashimotonis]|uniref:VanZ family protein n=1 Tax=Cohnella hashimotonis TaxID=2826895 RepID=A0ABT6TU03_9BACL|nr:VanZ family protein [Cohnella hashimotonis]MDI4650338.1 VanZ family protein [Cohnella hashimotonis]
MPLVLWLLLIFDFSSQTYSQQSIIPFMREHIPEHRLQQIVPDVTIQYNHSVIHAKADPYRFVEFLFRKSAHLFMYFMLGLLAHLLLVPWIRSLALRVTGALVVVALFASLDEWNQSFTGGRTPTPLDVMVDISGAVIGQIVLFVIIMIYRRMKRPGRRAIYS